ncbi:hypothetical protein N9I73_01685 [Porticoccaceae bacterium]|nr:hypothetical protein [Porticoccaceae bacterium]MDA9014275.1 hypothetical protein [Porticoccaceae bacterium]
MKTLTNTLLALLLSANVLAVEIPNQFEDGQVTSASQMNENFQALKAELEAQRALIEANLGNQKVVFQGFSAESMDGGQGLLAMQQACHNLVAGSHICKDTEIALSPYNPNAQNLEGSAWVLFELGPSVAGAEYTLQNSPISFRRIFDYHSYLGDPKNDRGCGSWNRNTADWRGAIVDSQLKGNDVLCSTQQKVACCK